MLLGYLTFSSSYCVWIYFCQFSIKSYTCQTNCTRFCSQFAKFYLLYPQKKNRVCKQIENASSSDKTSDLEACLLLKVWRWLAGQPHVYIIHQSYYVHEYNIHDIMYMYTSYVYSENKARWAASVSRSLSIVSLSSQPPTWARITKQYWLQSRVLQRNKHTRVQHIRDHNMCHIKTC